MTARFQRLRDAFTAARAEADPERREQILRDACRGDAEMLAELHALLAAQPAEDFLENDEAETTEDAERPRYLGEFELMSRIGSGASSVVWLAHQPSLDRAVALKVLTTGPGTTNSLIERFHREPLAVARLNHPHIVPVYAEGTDGDVHWFAMQYVDGHSLATELRVQRDHKPNDPQPLLPPFSTGNWYARVARLCADAADALQTAHENGIVHRDIKPMNLLLDRTGRLLVADFGIARDERFGSLTEPGIIAGTWHYMSPEQAKVANTPIDHRTDIYSLGVVLYELLTLRRPYDGSTALELLDQIRRAPVRNVRRLNRGVPRDLETICMAAMAHQPTARYQTARELRDDLIRFVEHEAIVQQPPSLLDRLMQLVRSHQLALLVVVAMLLAVLLGSAVEAGLRNASLRRDAIAFADAVNAEANLDQRTTTWLANAWRSISGHAEHVVPCATARQVLQAYRDELLRQSCSLVDVDERLPHPLAQSAEVRRRLERLLRATAAFPDDAGVIDTVSQVFTGEASIRIVDPSGNDVPAKVGYRLIDPMTGIPRPAVELAAPPIASLRLAEGQYRFLVTTADGRFSEHDRTVLAMHRLRLQFVVRRSRDAEPAMVRIEGGELRLPEDSTPSGLNNIAAEVEPFLLDRCEVTIGEYRAFLLAAGRPLPDTWARLDPARHDRLPVTDVTLADATAYAEWVGKRLPTYAEWAIAARGAGPSPRRFPWGDEGMHGNVNGLPPSHESHLDAFADYLRNAAVVDADPSSCTPEGVFELFGNVTEWTSSSGVDIGERGLVARLDKRIVAGHAWHVAQTNPGADLGLCVLADHGPTFSNVGRGFRCARSITP